MVPIHKSFLCVPAIPTIHLCYLYTNHPFLYHYTNIPFGLPLKKSRFVNTSRDIHLCYHYTNNRLCYHYTNHPFVLHLRKLSFMFPLKNHPYLITIYKLYLLLTTIQMILLRYHYTKYPLCYFYTKHLFALSKITSDLLPLNKKSQFVSTSQIIPMFCYNTKQIIFVTTTQNILLYYS